MLRLLILLHYLNQQAGRENLVFADKQAAEMGVTRELIKLCREWYGKRLGPRR